MTLLIQGHPFAYEMECLLRLFFPGAKIHVQTGDVRSEEEGGDSDTVTTGIDRQPDGSCGLRVAVRIRGRAATASARLDGDPAEQEQKLALGRLLYGVLAEQTGKRFPWGILTGVRPVRLCRSVLEEAAGEEEARRILEERYCISREKLSLALETARVQGELLAKAKPDGFSLYISIPFCPSRCLYCSFVSHDIAGSARLVPEYVRLLCEEIRQTGEMAARRGLRLQTVYVGGGTPTILEAEQLRQIMEAVNQSFDRSGLLEYTVEAGRPDTITHKKLAALRELGADRISINPQTMDDGILREIGRRHTAAQVEEGFRMAREAGFRRINMDLIAGLPGEDGRAFASSLDRVLDLAPENITVHTLTVKRSSHLRDRENAFAERPVDLAALLDEAGSRLAAEGYRPYYLYRQKNTVQNLENTGYAHPGTEGLYNVYIMEEMQTILAVGAGAVTKLCREGKPLRRVFNFKFPHEYIGRFDEMLLRKSQVEAMLEERL